MICGEVVFRSATAGAVEERDLLVFAAAQTAVPKSLLRRAISGRDGAEALGRAGLGAAEQLLGRGRAGRAHVGGEVGAAGRAVPQPRGAGPPRPAVEVVVRALEDLARGQVVHGEAVEPGKGGMGFELIFMVAHCNFGSGWMKEMGFRDSQAANAHAQLLTELGKIIIHRLRDPLLAAGQAHVT